jgi:hypothetical protein
MRSTRLPTTTCPFQLRGDGLPLVFRLARAMEMELKDESCTSASLKKAHLRVSGAVMIVVTLIGHN